MGFSPRDVDAMTIWEFNCCAEAYARANGAKGKGSGGDMSDDRLRELGIHGFNGT